MGNTFAEIVGLAFLEFVMEKDLLTSGYHIAGCQACISTSIWGIQLCRSHFPIACGLRVLPVDAAAHASNCKQ